MPVVIVFHERDPFSFHRVSDDGSGLVAARLLQLTGDGLEIVSVNFGSVPSERGPLGRERFESHDLVASPGSLPLVVVDDDGQLSGLLSRGEQGRLPDRALVALTVAHGSEDAIIHFPDSRGQSETYRDRQALP